MYFGSWYMWWECKNTSEWHWNRQKKIVLNWPRFRWKCNLMHYANTIETVKSDAIYGAISVWFLKIIIEHHDIFIRSKSLHISLWCSKNEWRAWNVNENLYAIHRIWWVLIIKWCDYGKYAVGFIDICRWFITSNRRTTQTHNIHTIYSFSILFAVFTEYHSLHSAFSISNYSHIHSSILLVCSLIYEWQKPITLMNLAIFHPKIQHFFFPIYSFWMVNATFFGFIIIVSLDF